MRKIKVGDIVAIMVDSEKVVGEVTMVSKMIPGKIMISGMSEWVDVWQCSMLKFGKEE